MSVKKTHFGQTNDGKPVDLYTCANAQGLVMKVMTYGAIVVELQTPDRDDRLENITRWDLTVWPATSAIILALEQRWGVTPTA